jgi:hypothetical protein
MDLVLVMFNSLVYMGRDTFGFGVFDWRSFALIELQPMGIRCCVIWSKKLHK